MLFIAVVISVTAYHNPQQHNTKLFHDCYGNSRTRSQQGKRIVEIARHFTRRVEGGGKVVAMCDGGTV